MSLHPRAREHIALMSKGVIALSGASGLAGIYGVYVLIHEAHHSSGWFWLFLGAATLFLTQIQVVQRALKERDAARDDRDEALRARDTALRERDAAKQQSLSVSQ